MLLLHALVASLLLLVSILFALLLLVDEVPINVLKDLRERNVRQGASSSLSSFDEKRIEQPRPRSAHFYPTQYITPDQRDSANRNITLTVKKLRKRAVYILEWSSALEDPVRRRVSVLVSAPETELSPTPSSNGSERESLLLRPSVLASRYGCRYAVNAGPFGRDGEPVGSVVSNGRVRQFEPPSGDFVGFGVTEPRTNASASAWVVGSLSAVTDLESLREFVTGFGWLVYQGRNVVVEPDDDERTGATRAPRTAMGVTAHGSLVVVVADGCEKCLFLRGPTLKEMSEILISRGVQFAVNMDGGGSSVMVGRDQHDDIKILSRPTCWDVDVQCERPVATVFCMN